MQGKEAVMSQMVLWVMLGTGFTFFMTALGAAMVFFFTKDAGGHRQRVLLGFAAGVMIAASVWSLLLPAIEQAENAGESGLLPAAGGFLTGSIFLMILDNKLPQIYQKEKKRGGQYASLHRNILLVTAVTLHNIPEGMAVGLAFALAMQKEADMVLLAEAFALAIGIGIQNFPEGAAVSLPLRQDGMSKGKSFLIGSLSGAVEFIFGMGIALVARQIQHAMPWLLSFAAGTMIYVSVKELIPESQRGVEKREDDKNVCADNGAEADADACKNWGTAGVLAGFLIMMMLDVALG